MKGYHPLDNGTLFSDGEIWMLKNFDPEHVPSKYAYLKRRVYQKIFGERGALNLIMNYSFAVKYEEVSKVELEEVLWLIEELLKRLKV